MLAIKKVWCFRFIQFNQEAENASKSSNVEDRLNLQDIVYCTARDLQNITDTHLAANTSFLVWEKLLESVFEGIPEAQLNLQEEIILTSNSDILYLKLLVGYLAITPLAHIELYIWWNVVEELILHTTMEVRRLYYEYYKTISTADGFSSRTLYCTGTVNRLLGMAVSYAISNNDFTHHTKPKVQDMLGYIRTAFEGLVRDTTWMDWSTKRSTLQKTAAMRSLIGFPEWILDQQRLEQHYNGVCRTVPQLQATPIFPTIQSFFVVVGLCVAFQPPFKRNLSWWLTRAPIWRTCSRKSGAKISSNYAAGVKNTSSVGKHFPRT